MELYEIFKSEGGFRVCGGVLNDCPVIDASPWFATIEEAQENGRKMKFQDCTKNIGVFEVNPGHWIVQIDDNFLDAPNEICGIKEARNAIISIGFTEQEIDAWRPDLKA